MPAQRLTRMNRHIFRFAATEAGSEQEKDLVIVGVAGNGHYFTFQRSLPVSGTEDWGIHVEFDDQSNSGYEKIGSCRLTRSRLRVELVEPIDWQSPYKMAEIELQVSDSEYYSLAGGLRSVFAQREQLLSVDRQVE